MIYAVNQEEVRRRKALAYTRELTKNSDGTWFARIVEFPGCMTEGETTEEALSNLDDAMGLWIETRLEDGDSIPEPVSTDAYSGKFLVRVPKGLHREIARRAELEGVSLNLFVSVALARAVGEKSAIDRS
jgi:predicted RNase H-like HicB family nuclease